MNDKQLDKWIAEKVMGYGTAGTHCCLGIWARVIEKDKVSDYFDWHPTESISDAFRVVEKMKELQPNWYFELLWWPEGGATFTIFESAEGHIVFACEEADTEPMAICLAVKKAIEDIEDE